MTHSTVLVLGAAGRLGSSAVQAFAAAGWRVLAQVRRTPLRRPPAGVEVLTAPLHDIDALRRDAADARVVVYAVNPIYTRWDTEMMPLVRHGMDIAERLGALFMMPGNVYNFGEQMPPVLSESTPQRPTTTKGRQRCELEAEILRRTQQGSLRAAILRAGDFFGQGSGNWFDLAIVKDIAKGKIVYPGPTDQIHAWAYLPDLARAFVAVAEQDVRPDFQSLHFAGHALTGAELLAGVEAAAIELGIAKAPLRRGGMPWGLIRTVGTVYPMWRELARMSYLWRVPHALDGAALARAVGPLTTTPLAVALRQSLLEAKMAG